MFYKLQCSHAADALLSRFTEKIEKYCFSSEFQFLSRETLVWNIPAEKPFTFQEFYYINNAVPVFDRQLWEKISAFSGTDGVFVIPLEIIHCGERHYFYVAVPPRIKCLDSQGRILRRNAGRYRMFRTEDSGSSDIFITEHIYALLKGCPDFITEGV